jgi:DNA-binding transcriptional regulator YiaG
MQNHALRDGEGCAIIKKTQCEVTIVGTDTKIIELRKRAGMTRKEFSAHTGIPVRTLEDWEAARRTPPDYIPRLVEYQLKYEELLRAKAESDKN